MNSVFECAVETRIGGNVAGNDDMSVLVILVGQPIPLVSTSSYPGSHQCTHKKYVSAASCSDHDDVSVLVILVRANKIPDRPA